MLTYYMSKYLLKATGGAKATTIVVDGVEEKHIREAAEATKGFSGERVRFFFVVVVVVGTISTSRGEG